MVSLPAGAPARAPSFFKMSSPFRCCLVCAQSGSSGYSSSCSVSGSFWTANRGERSPGLLRAGMDWPSACATCLAACRAVDSTPFPRGVSCPDCMDTPRLDGEGEASCKGPWSVYTGFEMCTRKDSLVSLPPCPFPASPGVALVDGMGGLAAEAPWAAGRAPALARMAASSSALSRRGDLAAMPDPGTTGEGGMGGREGVAAGEPALAALRPSRSPYGVRKGVLNLSAGEGGTPARNVLRGVCSPRGVSAPGGVAS
mmetsp:Transcript_18442/g.52053  ORF Transcript_18442/g.52053 Transcript_18442/m.52053 type:complete len:256 (-) Transcript_18442:25-792(-)